MLFHGEVKINRKKSLECRSLCGARKRDSCRPIFKELNILTFPCIYLYECSLFVKKNEHLFHRNRDYHTYPTRHQNQLRTEQHNTVRFERGPYHASALVYNKLPDRIKILPLKKFKNALKNYFLDNQFYDVNKFFSST